MEIVFCPWFSPHKVLLWNNADITVRNKSLFSPRWFNNNLNFILSVFDHILPYEKFLNLHNFPVPPKEYNILVRVIQGYSIYLALRVGGIEILYRKCNKKTYIRKIFQTKRKITPRGKFYWGSFVTNINWRKAWLLPSKFCISNKVKETHYKILHTIYPVNLSISKYSDIVESCSFCGFVEETASHLFF